MHAYPGFDVGPGCFCWVVYFFFGIERLPPGLDVSLECFFVLCNCLGVQRGCVSFDCSAMSSALGFGRFVPHINSTAWLARRDCLTSKRILEARPIYIAMAENWRAHGTRDDAHFGQAHMGPIPLRGGGTLTAADRQAIMHRTGCSASVRFRQQWGERCLTITGPAEWLTAAKDMANDMIRRNGEDGGRVEEPSASAGLPSRSEFQTMQDAMSRHNQQVWGYVQALTNSLNEVQGHLKVSQAHAQQTQLQLEELRHEFHEFKRKRSQRKSKKEKKQRSVDDEARGHGAPAAAAASPERRKTAVKDEPSGDSNACDQTGNGEEEESNVKKEEHAEPEAEHAEEKCVEKEAVSPTSDAGVAVKYFFTQYP